MNQKKRNMWTTSFSRSIRGNQPCINLKSHLGSPTSFVPNQLQKYNIRDYCLCLHHLVTSSHTLFVLLIKFQVAQEWMASTYWDIFRGFPWVHVLRPFGSQHVWRQLKDDTYKKGVSQFLLVFLDLKKPLILNRFATLSLFFEHTQILPDKQDVSSAYDDLQDKTSPSKFWKPSRLGDTHLGSSI